MLSKFKRYVVRDLLKRGNPRFTDSATYWEQRYLRKLSSGAGSYGLLARFKAEVVNRVVEDLAAESVIEWGSGDGSQLAQFKVKDYTGIDVSSEAVRMCRAKFIGDDSRRFLTADEAENATLEADLSLSLDVIYHLVEDSAYEEYMWRLFDSARLGVLVYSSNRVGDRGAGHVRHRRFSDWVSANRPDWLLSETIPNPYPFDANRPNETSFADFYLFRSRISHQAGEARV